ncbi:MAG: tRNA uridine-5-carboxymethylaminomethyl(34) synthesis GTPase MnmE [Bacillota bacterium]
MNNKINKLSEYALDETIAAIATPIGSGGIGIVRISGAKALSIAANICNFISLKPRYMTYGKIYRQDGTLIDDALIVYMPGPHSYTGEDVVELQCHGGAQVPAQVLAAVIQAGARLAMPGEFTLRAFLNGRIDLTQAEAIDDLIQAQTPQAATVLAQQVSGRLSQELAPIEDDLLDLLASIEVGVDFPDDEDALHAEQIIEQTRAILLKIENLLAGAEEGRIIKEGINVCLLGAANVGKSSLMNALLAQERAIVTQFEGTTRDVIEEYLNLGGLPILLSDTAGLRQAKDEAEHIGISKSHQKAIAAQLILLVLDCSRPITEEERAIVASYADKKMIILLNKSDIASGEHLQAYLQKEYPHIIHILVSAKTRSGLDNLEKAIKDLVLAGKVSGQRAGLINNIRHQEALMAAKASLEQAIESLEQGCPVDLAAIDLQSAWQSFGEISGKTAGEEVITRIFSKFCLGK